jgi:hypothetical protein
MSAASKPPSKRDLQLAQDMAFQHRNWKSQRIGWMLVALVIVTALIGLWGSGPASSRSASAADGSFRIEYERFTRLNAPTQLRLHFAPKAVHAGEVRVWLEGSYAIESFPQQVAPMPRLVEAGESRFTYIFAAQAGRGGSVLFDMRPQKVGAVAARIGVGESALDFRQFVYP